MLRKLIKTTTINSYNKYALLKVNNFHNTLQQKVAEEPAAMDNKHLKRINEIVVKYNKEEQEKILKSVNNYNLNELLRQVGTHMKSSYKYLSIF